MRENLKVVKKRRKKTKINSQGPGWNTQKGLS